MYKSKISNNINNIHYYCTVYFKVNLYFKTTILFQNLQVQDSYVDVERIISDMSKVQSN